MTTNALTASSASPVAPTQPSQRRNHGRDPCPVARWLSGDRVDRRAYRRIRTGSTADYADRYLELVDEILANTAVHRLRLSSIEPWDIAGENLKLWKDKRLCRHLHLPLQSGSNAVLGRMRRHYTSETFACLVEHARRIVPEIAITTDVIVGFPGETDAEFAETLRFVEAMHFRKVHIFPFSSREGTGPAGSHTSSPRRSNKTAFSAWRRSPSGTEMAYCEQFVNRTVEVLWETQTGAAEWSG